MSAGARVLMIILIVLGILALIAGIIYFVEPAKSIPSFFPGHKVGVVAKHTKRGLGGIVLGVVLIIAGFITARVGRRSAQY